MAGPLARRVSVWAPAVIAGVLLAVGLVRLSMRGLAVVRAARERAALARGATLNGRVRAGWRRVALIVSGEVEGSPFTGGVVRPYIVFPERVWRGLSAAERRAAIAHELAHVAEHHVLVTIVAGVLRDVFWFVPFIGAAERRLREACELAADARAVKRGTPAEVLASALLRARESMPLGVSARAAALGATDMSIGARIEHLLDTPPLPRFGFGHAIPRAMLTLWVAATVLAAVAFGNH
ncbi:MAG: M56 family metallopeptidase [Polyangiaceae bacterium]